MTLRGRMTAIVRFTAKTFRKFARTAILAAGLLCLGFASPHAAETTYRDAIAAARATMERGDLKGAESQMRDAVNLYPNNPQVHALLAEIYLKLGDSPSAEDEARIARWHDGDDDEIAPILAEAMLRQDKMSQLIHDVTPGSREMKSEAAVRRALALAHITLGEIAPGEALLADSRRLDPDSDQSHIGIARLDLVQGHIADAEKELAAARALTPDAIDVLRLEADLMRAKGDFDGAVAAYGKAIEEFPDDITLLVGRATVLISQNRLDDAQRDVDAALALAPRSITPLFLSGVLLARRGDIKGADDVLTGVSAAFDGIPDGYYVLGAVKYVLGQYDSAIFYLAQYVGRRPDEVPPRLLLASSALRRGDPLRAITVLGPAVYVNNADSRAVSLLEQAYIAAGRQDDAFQLYAQQARAKPNDPRFGTEAAMVELGKGDLLAGTEALEKIASTDKGLGEAGPVLALAELRLGHLVKAEDAAQRFAAMNSDNDLAQLIIGLVRMAQLRYGEAEKIFVAILAHDPNFMAVRYNLAQLYAASGRPSQAKDIYNNLLQQNQNDQTALRGLAEIAASGGNADEAEQWLTRAQAAAPADPSPTRRLIEIETAAGNWPDAIAAAQGLAEHFPDPDSVQILAATLAKSGNTKAAAAALQDYLAHNNGTISIYRALASYQRAMGEADAANKSLEAALDLRPNDEGAITDLVDLDYATNGVESAVDTAYSFTVRAPELADLLAANVLARDGQLDEAIASLRQGLLYHPSPRNAGRLAELTFAAGNHEQAEAMLHGLIEKQDDKRDDVPLRLSLANMDMLDGHADEAISLYEQVLARVPNEVLTLNNLATLYEAKDDPRALELALQAYRIAPDPETADTLGWALVLGGDPVKGLPYLEKAASAQPQALEVQYHLAVALQGSGAVDRARSLLERIVAAKAAFAGKDDAQRRLEALRSG